MKHKKYLVRKKKNLRPALESKMQYKDLTLGVHANISKKLMKEIEAYNAEHDISMEIKEQDGRFHTLVIEAKSIEDLKAWWIKFGWHSVKPWSSATFLQRKTIWDNRVEVGKESTDMQSIVVAVSLPEDVNDEAYKEFDAYCLQNDISWSRLGEQDGYPVLKLFGADKALRDWYNDYYTDGSQSYDDFKRENMATEGADVQTVVIDIESKGTPDKNKSLADDLKRLGISYEISAKHGSLCEMKLTGPAKALQEWYSAWYDDGTTFDQFLLDSSVESSDTKEFTIPLMTSPKEDGDLAKFLDKNKIKYKVGNKNPDGSTNVTMTGTKSAMQKFYKEYWDDDEDFDTFVEDYANESEDDTQSCGVFRVSNGISSECGNAFDVNGKPGELIETFTSIDEAKTFAEEMNSKLTPAEKQMYSVEFVPKELTEDDVNKLKGISVATESLIALKQQISKAI